MKTILAVIVGVFSVFNLLAQSTVSWVSPSSAITTNNFQGSIGPISGLNTYRFGLYVGASGVPESSLTLLATTMNNSIVPGALIPSSVLLPMAPGTLIAFQVRGWSSFAGATYEEALGYATANNQPTAYLGRSPVGTYTMGSGQPMQSDSFTLTPVPEPSAIGLLVLAGTMLLLRRSLKPKCL